MFCIKQRRSITEFDQSKADSRYLLHSLNFLWKIYLYFLSNQFGSTVGTIEFLYWPCMKANKLLK